MSKAVIALVVALSAEAAVAEQFVQTLTDSQRSVNVQTWEVSSRQVTPGSGAAWSVRKYPLHGGKQEGVDVVVVDNGKLQITIIPTRGMGILSVTSGDVRLGWDSPVKEVVNPRNVNLALRGGLGWLEGFNEWVVRCGLEFAGAPGQDKFINNVGDEATMDLTLHGRIANIPASKLEVAVETSPPYRIHIRGQVDERNLFGPKLELATDISTEPGSAALRIEDVVTNRGDSPQEYELIYHTNYGKPLLEEGSTLLAPVERVSPINAHAAESIGTYTRYEGPKQGFIEQVYCLYPMADQDGKTLAMLQNRSKDRAVSIGFSIKELPFLTIWKNTGSMNDGYVTGIEPGTDFPYNRRIERKQGRLKKLAAGEAHHVTLDVAIHVGEGPVRQLAQKIAAVQGDRKAILDEAPAKVE